MKNQVILCTEQNKGENIESIELPNPYPKVMEVWNDGDDDIYKKTVLGEFEIDSKTYYVALNCYNEPMFWDNARDIPTKKVKRMTLEEIAQELGVDEVEVIDKTN